MMMNKQILPPQCAMFNIELRYRNNAVLQIEILFERNGLEFLQNDKVEVFSKKFFCLFLKRKYLTFRRLENASLIFFFWWDSTNCLIPSYSSCISLPLINYVCTSKHNFKIVKKDSWNLNVRLFFFHLIHILH